jgi:hypothetical protein
VACFWDILFYNAKYLCKYATSNQIILIIWHVITIVWRALTNSSSLGALAFASLESETIAFQGEIRDNENTIEACY